MQPGKGARAESVQRRYDREEAWRLLAAIEQIAQESGSTPAAISLAWLLARQEVTAPILGARSVPQLEACLDALTVTLAPAQLALLDTVSGGDQER